jgi:hypothetical protein
LTYLGNHTKNKREFNKTSYFKLPVRDGIKNKVKGLKYPFLIIKPNIRKLHTRTTHQLHTGTTHQLGYYLAGLIEGDGSIILRKGEREKISPKIVLTFSGNEIPMFAKLQRTLNTGVIYTEANGVCRYSVTNADAVIKIIHLVNGKFRTPKIQALYKAIDNLNKWRNANIVKLPLDSSSIDSNAWLAGFIDTDGHFSIKLTGSYGSDDSEVRGRVQCVFSLAQSELNRVTGESNVPVMTLLANFFQVNLLHKIEKASKHRGSAKTISFFAQSDSKHYIEVDYLTRFPLMTSKHLNYLAFFKGLSYLGKRLEREEVLEIRAIKSSMNKKRTYYNWDHLNSFYSE